MSPTALAKKCEIIIQSQQNTLNLHYTSVMAVKNEFSSKIGLVAATVGSAVGLGNIWRFPAEAQAGGGAAFLLVYILCVCVLGIPVMLAEFSIGRAGGTDAIGAFRKLSPGKAWWMVGALAILTSYLILSFYMVVAGWTFEYMWQSITGGLYAPVGDTAGLSDIAAYDIQFAEKMHTFIQGRHRPSDQHIHHDRPQPNRAHRRCEQRHRASQQRAHAPAVPASCGILLACRCRSPRPEPDWNSSCVPTSPRSRLRYGSTPSARHFLAQPRHGHTHHLLRLLSARHQTDRHSHDGVAPRHAGGSDDGNHNFPGRDHFRSRRPTRSKAPH